MMITDKLKMMNKVLSKENTTEEVDGYFFKIGYLKLQIPNESRKLSLFRCLVTIIPLIVTTKFLTSILIYYYKSDQIGQYKMLLTSINDFTYFMPKIRIHANLVLLFGLINASIQQFVMNKLLYSNGGHEFYWMKLFQMLSGKVKPLEIGLIHWGDVMVLVKR